MPVPKGKFKQRDNEFKFVLDGKQLATIALPTDALGNPPDPIKPSFRVRQEVVVGGLCMTVQLVSERARSKKTYKCVPALVP